MVDAIDILERLERLQHAQQAAILTLAQRIDRLTDQLQAEQRHGLTARGAGPEGLAVALARSGAGIDELVRQCGLRSGEAELIFAVHGRPATASNVSHVSPTRRAVHQVTPITADTGQ